jgi:predicted transcriptional regulator
MSTTTPRGVLSSLLAEDRPWTVDELVREKGDRLSVEDALSELDAVGLLTRVNKRVVCASRAAIHADRMEDE